MPSTRPSAHARLHGKGGGAGFRERVVRFAAIALALLLASTAWSAIALVAAPEAYAAVPVRTVDDDDFAPEGYSWRFDFQTASAESGFERIEDLTPYYSYVNRSDPDAGFYDCVKAGDAGYAAFIDKGTDPRLPNGEPRFALRFCGGSYNGRPIDAVLTIADWAYLEADGGWDGYGIKNDPVVGFDRFRTGIFYNEGYTNDSRYRALNVQPSLSNINLYVVGLTDVSVELSFVEAGTDVPVAVQGHATSIDLDCSQGMTFLGGIDSAEVAKRSLETSPTGTPFLSIDSEVGRVSAGTYAADANDADQCYDCALVGTYFSTGAGRPYAISFHSPWDGASSSTAMSFFALTPEYVASPAPSDLADVAKSASAREPVQLGETFTFSVDIAVPVEGLTCRIGYRYSGLAVKDALDPHLGFVEGSCRALRDGEPLGSVGTCSHDAASNTVLFEFDEGFLASEQLVGQTITVEFDAVATSYPELGADGRYLVPNKALVIVNDAASLETNTVHIELAKGGVTVRKVAEGESGAPLEGARFSLETADGTLVRDDIVTGSDGTATVSDLAIGDYVLTETAAPEGYAATAEPIEFSLREDAIADWPTITVRNGLERKRVVVEKRILASDAYWHHGDPTFSLTLAGQDALGGSHAYRALAVFEEDAKPDGDGYLTATVVFEGVPAGSYVLSEGDAVRYELATIESNGIVSDGTAAFDLVELDEGWARLTNRKTSSYGGSDATSVINWFDAC